MNSRGGRGLQNLRYMYLAEEIRIYVYIQLYIQVVYIQGQIHVNHRLVCVTADTV